MTTKEKQALCSADVTLDGKPAAIGGALLDFAVVGALGDSALRVEFAWPTVARIVANGGAFRS